MNFYNTLLVIVTVNCIEFLQNTLSNCDGEFLHTLLVIVMVSCGEFLKTLLDIVTANCGEFLYVFLAIVTVNCGEFLKHSLRNYDGELRCISKTNSK